MSTPNQTDSTTVTEVDLEALDMLNMPGATNIITQTPEAKNNVFTKTETDLSFIDNDDPDDKDKKNPDGTDKTPTADEILDDVTKNDNLTDLEKEELAKKDIGKPKQSKEVMVSVINKLIETGRIIPFDDDKKVEDYTANDLQELIEANFTEYERKVKEQTPLEFFDSLPQELQFAAKYVQDGGKNLKGLFRSLAQAEETKELDVKTPEGQKQIVLNYLRASTKLSDEDIQEEISSWEDRNELEGKATKFKPKLDLLQEEIITQQVQLQEENRKKQLEQSNKYMDNIYNALLPGNLNGITLDKKTQSMLYAGLVQPNYPSIGGRGQTNLLGHLLEKYQFVEPNHALIAEALYLLQDPEAYREKVREVAKKETITSTVRTLKSEESRKSTGSGTGTNDEPEKKSDKPTLKRTGSNNMFKRDF